MVDINQAAKWRFKYPPLMLMRVIVLVNTKTAHGEKIYLSVLKHGIILSELRFNRFKWMFRSLIPRFKLDLNLAYTILMLKHNVGLSSH